MVSGCIQPTKTVEVVKYVEVVPSPTPPTPSHTPSPISTVRAVVAYNFTGNDNYTEDFYLYEGLTKFDLDVYGNVWLIDIDNKRVIPISQGGYFSGMKAIYIQHYGFYRLNMDNWYRIVVLN